MSGTTRRFAGTLLGATGAAGSSDEVVGVGVGEDDVVVVGASAGVVGQVVGGVTPAALGTQDWDGRADGLAAAIGPRASRAPAALATTNRPTRDGRITCSPLGTPRDPLSGDGEGVTRRHEPVTRVRHNRPTTPFLGQGVGAAA
ncbi:hypothetical protein Acsp07_09270 [Actinomycetospora sp. NBRC 106378]|nr:hypothetical protein Acsp07_09270 [Actinomycetospora sp. NBRC 106378]